MAEIQRSGRWILTLCNDCIPTLEQKEASSTFKTFMIDSIFLHSLYLLVVQVSAVAAVVLLVKSTRCCFYCVKSMCNYWAANFWDPKSSMSIKDLSRSSTSATPYIAYPRTPEDSNSIRDSWTSNSVTNQQSIMPNREFPATPYQSGWFGELWTVSGRAYDR